MLVHAAKVGSCPECEKYVILLIDEMHVSEDLVYDKHTGELVGFANLGDVNQHLLAFEGLFFMYISLEYVMFTSCNDVLYLEYYYIVMLVGALTRQLQRLYRNYEESK